MFELYLVSIQAPSAHRADLCANVQGRGDRSTPERAASMTRQLEGLLGQLDGLLPYLGVTISSVGLLDAGGAPGLASGSLRESVG